MLRWFICSSGLSLIYHSCVYTCARLRAGVVVWMKIAYMADSVGPISSWHSLTYPALKYSCSRGSAHRVKNTEKITWERNQTSWGGSWSLSLRRRMNGEAGSRKTGVRGGGEGGQWGCTVETRLHLRQLHQLLIILSTTTKFRKHFLPQKGEDI